MPLTPLPPSLSDDPLLYCGSYTSPPPVALQLALGNLDLHSLAAVTHFSPDDPPRHDPKHQPKYGSRTKHPTIWRGQGSCPSPLLPSGDLGTALQVSSQAAVVKKPPPVARLERKKPDKVSLDSEEQIALLLDQDSEVATPKRTRSEEQGAELPKRPRLEVPSGGQLRRMVGDCGVKQGVTMTSSYFAVVPQQQEEKTPEKEQEPTPEKQEGEVSLRRSAVAPEQSGSWFSAIDRSASAEGRFIYRPVLVDVTNSPPHEGAGEKLESKTDTPRRNPFAKKLLEKKEVSEQMKTDTPKRNPNSFVVEEFLEDKCPGGEADSGVGSLPSSQLSLYSCDQDSITFTQSGRQELEDSQEQKADNPPSSPSKSSSVRVGLSKFAPKPITPALSTSSAPVASKSNFFTPSLSSKTIPKQGPRTLGLSRKMAPSLKQGSITSMFARSVKKAELGPAASQ